MHKYTGTLLLIFFTLLSYGQEPDTRKEAKHFIGIKAGQNISWLRIDPGVEQRLKTGSMFGISYSYMSQYFGGVLLEAQLIDYGWEEVFLDSASSYSRELSYLEFPVLTNLVIGRKKTHLKFQGGIKIGVLLNDKENSEVAEALTQIYNGVEIEDRFDLGLAFGTSLSRVFTFGELQLDARYNASLSNLFESKRDLSLLYSQNQGITVSLYFWFKIK